MSLGEKISEARSNVDMSRQQLADEVNCSYEMIRLVETDNRVPSLSLLKAILDVLLVDYILIRKGTLVLDDGLVKVNRTGRGRGGVRLK